MNVEEARSALAGEIGWREWEDQVAGLLKVNGWSFWRDRVIGTADVRAMGVPPASIPKALKIANSKGRSRGLSDLGPVWKRFENVDEMPSRLLMVVGVTRHPDSARTVMGYIECKTGSGRLGKDQKELLVAAQDTPGCFGYEARPENRAELVEFLGGKEPI